MKSSGTGIILAGSILTLEAAGRELGLSAAGLRAARRSGLRVRRCGRRGFIFFDDLADWIRTTDKNKDSPNA